LPPKLFLVVPCYNEQDRLDLASFRQALIELPYLHFMFVDDGSQDETWKMLDQFCREAPNRLFVKRLAKNQGKAEAVRSGFNESLSYNPDFIGYWDADLATPLIEVEKMMSYFGKQDLLLVMGARVKLLGRQIERYIIRHYIGRVFATFVSVVLRLAVYDTQCGAKIFRVTKPTEQAFAMPFSSKWIFDVEIIARLQSSGVVGASYIYEHPLQS